MLRLVKIIGFMLCLLPSAGLAADSDKDGVNNAVDRCANTPRHSKVNPKGCHFDHAGALFTVQFKAGSAWISGEQTLALRRVAKQLAAIIKDFPGTQVAVRGYNGGEQDHSKAEDLSLMRAKTVMRQLKLSRVPPAAMRVEGMGRAAVAGKAAQARRVDVLVLEWQPPAKP